MLSIYLYSNSSTSGGFLDISADAALDMESLADIFDEDLSTGEFSLPVDIPWTDNNRRLLGFAERLQNNAVKSKYWRVDVYDDGFPELINGKLTILEKVGKWGYSSGKFSASIAGTKGLFGSRIKTKRLRDLRLGGPVNWTGIDSRGFANARMTGNYPQYNYLSFAPVAIENFIDDSRTDYDNEFLAKDTVNNIIAGVSTWLFGRPQTANPSLPAAEGDAEYIDYRTVPFFNLKFVCRACFEELGYTVQGAFFDSTEFDSLHIFNNYAIENYAAIIAVDYNRTITPANHIPDITVAEFLKKIFTFFNCYPTFIGQNIVQLRYRDETILNRTVAAISDYVGTDFDSSLQETDTSGSSGYKLAYTWDAADGYYSERVREITDKTLVATVATANDLDTLTIGRQLTTNDIAYVEAENMYYCVADATGSPVTWDAYAERLNDYTTGDGSKSIDTGISTLCQYVIQNPDNGLLQNLGYLGTRQGGSYRNNKGVQVSNTFDVRLFFIDYRSPALSQYPISYNHNRNHANTRIEPHSLAWQGAEGMATGFHVQWRALNENMEIVKTSINADRKVISLLNQNDSYEVNNVDFLPYKVERTIPRGQKFDISLVPF